MLTRLRLVCLQANLHFLHDPYRLSHSIIDEVYITISVPVTGCRVGGCGFTLTVNLLISVDEKVSSKKSE